MFVVTLEFSTNKARAGEFMEGHKAWIQRGFDNGIFLMVGSLQPDLGGGILANCATIDELERFLEQDPFVAEKVVTVKVLEITPQRVDRRLDFLAA